MYKFISYLIVLFLFKFIAAREMAVEPVTSFVPDASTRKPLAASIAKAKGAICVIKAGVNGERRATGVLIKPTLVVTSMHTFQATSSSGIVGPSDTKVAFGVVQGNMNTISNWIAVESIEPYPNNNDAVSVHKDFVVLKLKEDATLKGGNVVGVHWKWGLDSKGASVESKKGFILHFPILLNSLGSTDFDKLDMQISYAVSTDVPVLRPNIFLGLQHPMLFSWPIFKEFPGSSGGGLFDDDGNLLGIVKGRQYSTKNISEGPKNVTIVPIDYIVDNTSGSSMARSAFQGSKTIPDAVNHFIYTVVNSGSELDAPENSIHFGPTFQSSGQSYSFELSSMVRGAIDGVYKINLAFQLSQFSIQPV